MNLLFKKNELNQYDKDISALVDGNGDATAILLALTKIVPQIDPENFFGPFHPLILLNRYLIQGQDIVTLYRDVCGQSGVGMLAVLNAVEQNILSAKELHHSIATKQPIDTGFMVQKVQEIIPEFAADMGS